MRDMFDQVLYLRGVVLSVLALITILVWLPTGFSFAQTSDYLTVRFLDVGQGDAIHIITPDGYEMLVDGGSSAMVLRELSSERSFFDRSIDVVIATHPDTDHVGGLVDVLGRYSVDMLIETAVESNSPAAIAYEEMVRTEGARVITAQAGQRIQLGSTVVHVLSPYGDTSQWQSNNASIIIKIVYGETEFMLTGDAPSSIEDYLVRLYGKGLQSNVLKLGHHGSKTSSSELFLAAVNPEYAVVSAGKDNRYGHPKQEVVDRALKIGAEVVSTIDQGTVTFYSDGKRVWQE